MSAATPHDAHAIKAMAPDELVTAFRPFVGSIVMQLRRQLRLPVPVEDLEAYAYEGLLEAQARFDPDVGSLFTSYAYYRIRGAVIDGCRRDGWVGSRRADRRILALDEALREAGEAGRAAPPARSLVDAVQRVAHLLDVTATVYLLSEQESVEELAATPPPQEDDLVRRARTDLLRAAFQTLNDDEREVVVRHHFEEEPMVSIAAALGRSPSWVSRMNMQALEKLRRHILQHE